jgi:hypothetical protein
LADPQCWLQTIRFAVTKNLPDLIPDNDAKNLKKLSSENFSDTFTNRLPEDIDEGDDIVLWYSIQSYKEGVTYRLAREKEKIQVSATNEKANISGKYLIHGLFFGHESEGGIDSLSELVKPAFTGSRQPEYFPKTKDMITKEKRWDR